MRTTKRTFWNFQYRECDGFADYLEKQAEKGWHFKKWHMGLVFERGEPRKTKYAVEVFPKGDERDSRPEKDAREFAEYCEAAGWELVDGQRKFCIFRQAKSDAIPIATPEERFENIRNAERERLYLPLFYVLVTVLFMKIMGGDKWLLLFDIYMLILTGEFCLISIFSILDFFAALLWRWKIRRILAAGKNPVYKGTWWKLTERYILILGIIGMLGAFYSKRGDIADTIMVFFPVAFYSGTTALAAVFRPSVERRGQIYWGTFGISMLVSILVIFMFYEDKEPSLLAKQDVPLVQADYKDVSGQPAIYGEESKTLFGEKFDYTVYYDKGLQGTDRLQYEMYDCRYEWLKKQLWSTRDSWKMSGWETEMSVDEESVVECTEEWGAEEAWVFQLDTGFANSDYHYEICYPEKVVILRTKDLLDAEKIQIIKEKLELP